MKKNRRISGKILMALMILFFYLPIVYMIVFSFNESKSLTHFAGFSMQWYEKMLQSNDMMSSLYTTIIVAVIATIVSTVIGTITAIGISKSRKIIKDLVLQINDFPIMNPEIVTAIGLMLLFITFKVEKGFATLLIAHIAFCIPYVILSVMPKIKSLDSNLADAAMDLGATPWQALIKVIVPQIMPGIFAGGLIAFTMSFDDFIISYFATGRGVKNLSIMVYTMSKRINPSINAISTLVVVLITIALILVNVVPVLRKKFGNDEKVSSPWKKVVLVVLIVAIISGGFGLKNMMNAPGKYEGETLHVYNWGEYTGENIISEFEKMTGAKVVQDNFDSNEQMYIKLANGESFDVIVPSDYMIQRLIKEGRLQKLDHSKLECFDKLSDGVKNLEYDPGNKYSVPYFWGTVGIVYDKRKVDIKDLEKEGFNVFKNPKYKGETYLYDSERDSFMMALKALGYSMNTDDENELNKAYNWLLQCVKVTKPEIVTDEIIDNMAQSRKALGIMYSGDATYVMAENKNMGYYMPQTGTNLWSDAMVIPKNAPNPELAHEFIDFVSSYEGAMDNSSYVGYTSPNEEVINELKGPGGDFEGINAYVPRIDNKNDEIFEFNDESRKIISQLWNKVKISASNN